MIMQSFPVELVGAKEACDRGHMTVTRHGLAYLFAPSHVHSPPRHFRPTTDLQHTTDTMKDTNQPQAIPLQPTRAPTYDQDEVIAAVYDYYNFLTKLPYIDSSEIDYPPPTGWPNINPTTLQNLNKTDTVVKLLAHLPYLTESPHSSDYPPGRKTGRSCMVAVRTHIIDYHSAGFHERCTAGRRGDEGSAGVGAMVGRVSQRGSCRSRLGRTGVTG